MCCGHILRQKVRCLLQASGTHGPRASQCPEKGPTAITRLAGGGGVGVVRDQTDPTAHALPSTLTSWRVQKGCAGRGAPMGIPMPRPQERTWGHFCPHQWAGHADKGLRPKGTGLSNL